MSETTEHYLQECRQRLFALYYAELGARTESHRLWIATKVREAEREYDKARLAHAD